MSGVRLHRWAPTLLEWVYLTPQQRALVEANERMQQQMRGQHAALAARLDEFMRSASPPGASHDSSSPESLAGVRAVVARHLPQEQHP